MRPGRVFVCARPGRARGSARVRSLPVGGGVPNGGALQEMVELADLCEAEARKAQKKGNAPRNDADGAGTTEQTRKKRKKNVFPVFSHKMQVPTYWIEYWNCERLTEMVWVIRE